MIRTAKSITLYGFIKRHSALLIALLMGLLYFLFHFHFMQRYLDYDQVVYANNILKGMKKPFVNPHHLHFEISGKFFHDFMVKHFGEYGFTDLAFNLRLRSLLFGSTGIVITMLYIRSLTGRIAWGVLAALFMGCTHGYLLYTPKVDTAVFSTTWFIVMLYSVHLLLRARKFIITAAVATGVLFFTGIMLHQYLGFTCVALFFGIVVPEKFFTLKLWKPPLSLIRKKSGKDKKMSMRNRYIAAGVVTAVTTILTVSAYFSAGRIYLDLSFDKAGTSWNYVYREVTFQEWLFFYVTKDEWGKTDNSKRVEESFRGITDAFLSPRKPGPKWNRDLRFNYNMMNLWDGKSLVFNQLAIYLGISLLLFTVFLPGLWKRYHRDLFSLLLNMAFFTSLAGHWEPFYLEFWLIPAEIFIFLSILLFNYIGEKASPLLNRFSQVPLSAYVLMITLLFAGHNMIYNVVPQALELNFFGMGLWKESEYYMKLTGRKIYRNYKNPYRDIYNIKKVEIDWK
jgi:hypothetical protein